MIKTPPPLSLYVHLPWCVKKCPYCDFNAHPLRGELNERAYIDALIRDLEEDLPRVWGREIISIFFGGGTPSLFSPEGFDFLLSSLRARLPFCPSIEITLEANPGTVERNRARGSFTAYRQAGINRISLGIQSFSADHLKALGRVHDDRAAYLAVEEIQRAGFDRYNVDLMHGLPDQTLESALFDLNTAIQLGVPHLSWYQLTLEPNTLFAAKPPTLPSEEVLGDIEDSGLFQLNASQYHRYEVSAFAKKPRDESIHNRNYWNFGDYLGIGAGAHAKITDVATQSIQRFFKFKHPKMYLAAEKNFIQQTEVLSESHLPLEFMLNALRLVDGFPISLFEERTGLALKTIEKPLEKGLKEGLLIYKNEGQTIAPSELGLRFLNELLLRFKA
jgi:putative oxygen-independent coproporphyrinogen III oxidase